MKVQITTNGRDLARKCRAMANNIVTEQRAAAEDIANRLTGKSQEQLLIDVYAQPIRRSPTGRLLWKRSNQLMREEKWVPEGVNVRHQNRAPHYIHRWRYGKPGGRKAKAPQRASSWHRVALILQARWIGQRRQMAQVRAMRAGISKG